MSVLQQSAAESGYFFLLPASWCEHGQPWGSQCADCHKPFVSIRNPNDPAIGPRRQCRSCRKQPPSPYDKPELALLSPEQLDALFATAVELVEQRAQRGLEIGRAWSAERKLRVFNERARTVMRTRKHLWSVP